MSIPACKGCLHGMLLCANKSKHMNTAHFQEETVAKLVLRRHASELQIIGESVHCYTQNKKISAAIFCFGFGRAMTAHLHLFPKFQMFKIVTWCLQGEENNDWNQQQFRQCLTKFCCSTWALHSKYLSSLNLGNCCSLQQMLPIFKLHGSLLPVLYTNQKFINENIQARWVPNVLLNRITEKYSSS